jgi:hypothetical protein
MYMYVAVLCTMLKDWGEPGDEAMLESKLCTK